MRDAGQPTGSRALGSRSESARHSSMTIGMSSSPQATVAGHVDLLEPRPGVELALPARPRVERRRARSRSCRGRGRGRRRRPGLGRAGGPSSQSRRLEAVRRASRSPASSASSNSSRERPGRRVEVLASVSGAPLTAGANRIRPATRSGLVRATSMAMRPPCELPASQAGSVRGLVEHAEQIVGVAEGGLGAGRLAESTAVVGDQTVAPRRRAGGDVASRPGGRRRRHGAARSPVRRLEVLGGELRSVRGGEPTSSGHARRP